MTTQYRAHYVSAWSQDYLSCTLLVIAPDPFVIVPTIDKELYDHLRRWIQNISGEITTRDLEIVMANYVRDKEVKLTQFNNSPDGAEFITMYDDMP